MLLLALLLLVAVEAFLPASVVASQRLALALPMSSPEGGGVADKCGPCKMAPLCSGEYADKGCDGTGRILGGIAAVLPWFPAKVYRPCPSYLAAGYQYRREGQTVDQVLFSEPSDRMKELLRQRAMEQKEEGSSKEEKIDGSSAAEIDRILKEWNDKKKE
jgi:hypothetical protein